MRELKSRISVAPVLGVAVLQPEDARGDVGRYVLDVRHNHGLFAETRGVLKKELLGHLRSKRTTRRSLRTDPNGDRRGANQGYRVTPGAASGG